MDMTDIVKRSRPQKKKVGAFHHGNLREAVIDAAVRSLEKGEKVALRKIAHSLRVSDAAIYRHFKNRDAVLAAAGARGMEGMLTAMVDAIGEHGAASDRLKAVGRSYVRFAFDHPAWFRLYFSRAYMDQWGDQSGDMDLAIKAERGLKATLAELVSAEDVDDSYRAIWALSHGLANLVTERAFRRVDTDEQRLATADAAIDVFVRALGGT
jgi:AcrR family transcriptional regulator